MNPARVLCKKQCRRKERQPSYRLRLWKDDYTVRSNRDYRRLVLRDLPRCGEKNALHRLPDHYDYWEEVAAGEYERGSDYDYDAEDLAYEQHLRAKREEVARAEQSYTMYDYVYDWGALRDEEHERRYGMSMLAEYHFDDCDRGLYDE